MLFSQGFARKDQRRFFSHNTGWSSLQLDMDLDFRGEHVVFLRVILLLALLGRRLGAYKSQHL